jgi:ubiquitin-like 1-activating enzyme E1 B
MDPAVAVDGSATLVAPLAPVVPVMAPSLTRDSFNSQSLGRGLNAHVKQVGTNSIASFLAHPT